MMRAPYTIGLFIWQCLAGYTDSLLDSSSRLEIIIMSSSSNILFSLICGLYKIISKKPDPSHYFLLRHHSGSHWYWWNVPSSYIFVFLPIKRQGVVWLGWSFLLDRSRHNIYRGTEVQVYREIWYLLKIFWNIWGDSGNMTSLDKKIFSHIK